MGIDKHADIVREAGNGRAVAGLAPIACLLARATRDATRQATRQATRYATR